MRMVIMLFTLIGVFINGKVTERNSTQQMLTAAWAGSGQSQESKTACWLPTWVARAIAL